MQPIRNCPEITSTFLMALLASQKAGITCVFAVSNWPEIIPTFLSLEPPFVLSLSKGVDSGLDYR
ncbi:hypothetical protein, partial [Endozoicomonas sp. ONNA2]|uniref:hypothetical protein n=1 Tax=Endozoicomonas sp. ONNA2 TaxID=2828741 RepID=UPI002148BCB2